MARKYDKEYAHEYYEKYVKHGRKKGRKKKRASYTDVEPIKTQIEDIRQELKYIPKGKAGKSQRDKYRKQLKALRKKYSKGRAGNRRFDAQRKAELNRAREKMRSMYGDGIFKRAPKRKISAMKAAAIELREKLENDG